MGLKIRGCHIRYDEKSWSSVTNNIKNSISIIDMPYKTYENKLQALDNASGLLKATKAN